MEKNKQFLKILIEKKIRPVTPSEEVILDELAKEQFITDTILDIEKKQNDMLDVWKRRNRIEAFKNYQLKIPNGTVGRSYELFLDRHDPVFDNIEILGMDIPAELGLTYFSEERKLYGTLNTAGESKITLRFKLTDSSTEEKASEKVFSVFVNPDPKSLWKNLPSNREDKYWKEDNLSASAMFAGKKYIVGSKRGRSHAHEGIFRDDGFGHYFDALTHWGVIAVADGAGSSKYSRRGSEIACATVIEYFRQLGKEVYESVEALIEKEIIEPCEETQKGISRFCVEHIGKAAFEAHRKIKEEAEGEKTETRDFHTTLIFALLRQIKDRWFIASFWVGDGGIGIYDKGAGSVMVLGKPDSGEFAGQTRFLTMPDIFAQDAYISRIKYKIVRDFTALVLMSDGITDPKFQTDANLEKIEYWNALWEDLNGNNEEGTSIEYHEEELQNSEANLLNWMDFWSPGNHDDRTIAILF